VVLTGTAGSTRPVVLKLVAAIAVDVVRVASFPPEIMPLALTVVGTIAPGDLT
jgi:hypothetical protein